MLFVRIYIERERTIQVLHGCGRGPDEPGRESKSKQNEKCDQSRFDRYLARHREIDVCEVNELILNLRE